MATWIFAKWTLWFLAAVVVLAAGVIVWIAGVMVVAGVKGFRNAKV